MDSIDQFQVQTSGYSAQYAGQGVQNYSIRQGSNTWHGGVYEYIRNTVLDAWPFLSKVPTVTGVVPAGTVLRLRVAGLELLRSRRRQAR